MRTAYLAVAMWGEAEDNYPFTMAFFDDTSTGAVAKAFEWTRGHLVNPDEVKVVAIDGKVEL